MGDRRWEREALTMKTERRRKMEESRYKIKNRTMLQSS
jgi:hypothetical protein